jgi:hypothetical protein
VQQAAVPAANEAIPAPEPKAPNWGDYSAPAPTPLALPAMVYTLAAPPHNIVQPNVGLDYRSVVSDPDGVLPADEQLTAAINIYRPDGIAPAGVNLDHTLQSGRFLISFRYQGGFFDHNLVGSSRVSDASVLAHYQFVPSHLTQNRYVALVEYAPTDDFTVQLQLPYENNSAAYNQAAGPTYSSAFTNPGDVKINGLYVLYRRVGHQVHASLGVSVPTGFLDYQTVQPSATQPNLTYPLLTSSGTYDMLPGLTYRGQNERWTWGGQASGVLRFGLNRYNYRLGDQADLTTWAARRIGERWSVSGRLDAQFWGNIYRQDGRMNPALAPTEDPLAQAGNRLNGLAGFQCYLPGGQFGGKMPSQQFNVEAGLPIYQRLTGPQLGLDWIINANWNVMF